MECPICGGREFGLGPGGRKAINGSLPRCTRCNSLERHRSIRAFFNGAYDRKLLSTLRVLQFSRDPSTRADWFEKFEVSVYQGENSLDLQNIERPSKAYDLVICNHVLEHVADDGAALKELMRIVKDEGILFLSVPDPYRISVTREWGYPDEKRHGHYREYGSDILSRFERHVPGATVEQIELIDAVTGTRDVAYLLAPSPNNLMRKFTDVSPVQKSDAPPRKEGVSQGRGHSVSADDIWQYVRTSHPLDPKSSMYRYLTTHAARYARLIDDVRCYVPEKARILDVAGSSFTKSLTEHFCAGVSVDICQGVDVEKQIWSEEMSGYDCVILTEVIEHLGIDPALTLFQCNKVLRMGGVIIVTTVNISRHISIYDLIHGNTPYLMGGLFGREADRHDREYAPWELGYLVAAHGFDTELSTFDCYAHTERQEEAVRWVTENLSIDMRLHRDTICALGRKIANVESAVRTWPVYHFSVAANRPETLYPGIEKLVRLVE